MDFINWNNFKFWKPKERPRIDDLDRAVTALIETSMHIVPEKRFDAIKLAVETLFKDHRVYKYHPCNRKKKVPVEKETVISMPVYNILDAGCSVCMPTEGKHAAGCPARGRVQFPFTDR